MKTIKLVIALLAISSFSTNAYAVLTSRLTNVNPVMDGIVSPGEWNDAGYEADGGGLAGAVYAEWQNGLDYGSWSYDGKFSFLLHNIEQNTTYSNGGDPAYNVFDIYTPSDPVNKYLEVTVFYDGFSVNKYDSSATIIVDTATFNSATDLGPDQTGSYAWNDYFGIYAKGGYGNSAFAEGLDLAIDNDNQLFEVAYLNPSDVSTSSIPPVRRSMKDPDQSSGWLEVTYLDTTVNTVPEPSAFALLGFGLSGLLGLRRMKRDHSIS